MRKRALLLVLALSVAGCVETGDRSTPASAPATTQAPTSPTPTSTTSTDSAVTTSFGYDCPYTVYADPATEGQLNRTDSTVAYDDLVPERQTEFDRALANGSVEMETLPDVWSRPTIIAHEGNNYYTVAETC